MNRRKAITSLSLIASGATILPQIMLSGCSRDPHPYTLFEWGDTELLNEIGEVIIPSSPEVPGAKAANVGDFIQTYVTDCYKIVDQQVFLDGFIKFKLDIETKFDKKFAKLKPEDKVEVIKKLDAESATYQKEAANKSTGDFYGLLKQTILFGYFTSEIGATKSLRYVPIPGYQKGEIPYNGEKAWAL